MKKETYFCDFQNCNNEATVSDFELTVVFTTEQTEGRPCKPYLTTAKFDICIDCIKKIVDNRKIPTGSVAQGFNKYYI